MGASVAVIGAGIAGLAAAWRLKRAGLNPVVFEREGWVGGRMSSEWTEGFLIDKAAYTFPEYHRNLTSLLGGLGAGDALVQTPGTSSTMARGEEHKVKIGSPTDFLKYRLLSLRDKKDMVKLFLYAKSLGKALDLTNPTEKTFELEREYASEYILNNYSREILEYVAWPIFCEIFLGNPEDNSKVPFLATLPNLTWFKIFSFREGMGTIPQLLARELDVRLNTPVSRIHGGRDEGHHVEIGGDRPDTLRFDAVVMAVPSPLVPEILRDLPEDVASLFRRVRYAKNIVVALALDRRREQTSMINNLCRDEFSVVGTVVFDHHKGPDRMPRGKGLATAVLSERGSTSMFDEPDSKVIDAVLGEMDKAFRGISDEVIFGRLFRWTHGAVQLPPGAMAEKAAARRILAEEFRTLSFAGDGLHKSSLETSYNSGITAAEQVIRGLGFPL